MDINHLIYQNLKKNLKRYYLYIFALTFSIALYFAFVTLQYDPSMGEMKDTVEGEAAIHAGSIILIFIVAIFLLYANNIFIKHRGKEIGLLQLTGMTKGKIFRILSAENMILYFSSLIVGIFLGFSISKLINMILLKMTGIETIATLNFSAKAFFQTVIVFVVIYLFILLMNFIFIKKMQILSLFQIESTTEEKEKNLSSVTVLIGIFGFGFILFGYYISTKLFSGDFVGYKLLLAMLVILGSIMLGTYFFYKGSINFIFQLIRKKKDGYITLNHVLSLSSIMFRMKSNALLLTIITIVSALAIGLLSLTYITYYSVEKSAEQMTPNHFSIFDTIDAEKFTTRLEEQEIKYISHTIDIPRIHVDVSEALVPGSYDNLDISDDPRILIHVISDRAINMDIPKDTAILTKPAEAYKQMLLFKNDGKVQFIGKNNTATLRFTGLEEKVILPQRLTNGFPVAIVNNDVFLQLVKDIDLSIQGEYSTYIGVDIEHARKLEKANDIFYELRLNKWKGIWSDYESRLEVSTIQKQSIGLIMFIVGFLGLTFLIISGCIIYFKQMDESEAEKANYTILRKLGFTEEDLLRGIRLKQSLNFGIPLILGLSHSYFGIKSGWFIFGSEMWTPMIIVMVLYVALYSIFGYISLLYYKRVIKAAL